MDTFKKQVVAINLLNISVRISRNIETDAKKMRIGMHPFYKGLLAFSQNLL